MLLTTIRNSGVAPSRRCMLLINMHRMGGTAVPIEREEEGCQSRVVVWRGGGGRVTPPHTSSAFHRLPCPISRVHKGRAM